MKDLATMVTVLVLACTSTSCVGPSTERPVGETTTEETPAPLFNEIEYRFVGDRGELDDEGWLLLWVATLEGDLTGEVRWWFEDPNPIADLAMAGGSMAFYEGKWAIRVDGEEILGGRSGGKVVTRTGEDGVWDGHGVVTRASPAYQAYVGRRVYETGPVVFGDESPTPPWGRGIFVIQ